MLNEKTALDLIKDRFSNTNSEAVFLGIGDDCAAIEKDAERLIVTTTDCLVEDFHFKEDLITPSQLAEKSVSVSVSDIAAMGGVPKFFLSTIGITSNTNEQFISDFLDGLKLASERYNIFLIGGNVTSSEKFLVDITVLGEIEKDLIVKRSGANEGDSIFVTGTLGDSALGLRMLLDDASNQSDFLLTRHISPTPRLEIARMLAEGKVITSMIDISDGLLLDLERITVEYALGAEISLESIPLSDNYKKTVKKFSDNIYELALTGGEDYELLFAASKEKREKIASLSEKTGISIKEIGSVNASGVVKLYDAAGNSLEFNKKGFVHLG